MVIVALDGGANLRRCLRALAAQESAPAMQVIVAHDDRVANTAELRAEFPGTEFVLCAERKNYPALRSAGVRAARGAIIAATEDQCIPPPSWCASIVAEHRARTHGAIGGPVEKFQPDDLLAWAIYLREFGEYTPPMNEGPAATLTDCNVTYKRAALERIAVVWQHEFHEPQVHGALRAAGEQLWLAPALQVMHQRTMPLGDAVEERFSFGRLFAALRVQTMSSVARLMMIPLTLLLPLLFVLRVILRAVGKRRYLDRVMLALPYLVVFSVAWSLGELVGYITARGRNAAAAERRSAAI